MRLARVAGRRPGSWIVGGGEIVGQHGQNARKLGPGLGTGRCRGGDGGSEDRGKIRDALSKVSFNSTRGPFKFDEKGDPLLTTHVVKIVNGKETNGRDIPVQK